MEPGVAVSLRQTFSDLGYLFSNLEYDSTGSVVCVEATPRGNPLLAIPLARCWTKKAAQEGCRDVRCALATALRRNPDSPLLSVDSTWIVLHMLHEQKHGQLASIHRHLERLRGVTGTLVSWPQEDMEVLRPSFWWDEGRRRRQQLAIDYWDLRSDLGPDVCRHLGVAEASYRWGHEVLQQLGLKLSGDPSLDVLVPGFEFLPVETQAEPDPFALQLVGVQNSPVLVVSAGKDYEKGSSFFLSHGGLLASSGAQLAGSGMLLDQVAVNPQTFPWEGAILCINLRVDSMQEDSDEKVLFFYQLQESLRRVLRDSMPVWDMPGLCLAQNPLEEQPAVECGLDGELLLRVCLCNKQPNQPLPSRCLQVLGMAALADSSKQRDILMHECALEGVWEDAACESRGLRFLLDEIHAALLQYPAEEVLRSRDYEGRPRTDALCFEVLRRERQVLERAAEAGC